MAWYTDGTISITLATPDTVAGTGTLFLEKVTRGDILVIANKLYEITGVVSDTELEISPPYAEAGDLVDSPYAVIVNVTNEEAVAMMQKVDDFLTDRQIALAEFRDWTNGTANGGPNNDGMYPLTDRFGITTLVKCPARMAFDASNGGGSGDLTDATRLNVFLASSYGVVGGAGVDEAQRIQVAVDACGAAGGGYVLVKAFANGDPIYIDAAIQIEHDNVTLVYESPLIYGANAMQRINGGLDERLRTELGQTEMCKLRADATTDSEGRMVLPLVAGNGAFLRVGDRITARGKNDANGKALEKQTTIVKLINGDDITCADEPDYSFKATYPDSEWPDDATTGTTVAISVYSAMTADTGPDVHTVSVLDASPFNLGDYCYISDSRTEKDMMAPVPTNLLNAANMEIARVVGKDTTANTLTFDRPLRRQYLTAYSAGVVRMAAIKGSHIKTRRITWSAPQATRKNAALAINYGVDCTIECANMDGRGGRKGIGVRIAYGYNCHAIRSQVNEAYSFLSGEGYGLALYYSTLCTLQDNTASGNRHNYLLQTTTSCSVLNNVSKDDWISGIDLHGAGCVGTWVYGNRVGAGVNFAPGVTNHGGIRVGNTSHTIGDHDTIIENNFIEGYIGEKAAAIDVSPSSRDCLIRNNTMIDCSIGVRHYKVGSTISPAQHSNRIVIDSNVFQRIKIQPLDISNASYSYWDEVVLIGNRSIDNAVHFLIKDVPKVLAMDNLVIAPRANAGAYAYDFQNIQDLKVYRNYTQGTSRGVNVKNCVNARVVLNPLSDTLESIPVNDGGGNGALVNLANDDDFASLIVDTSEIEAMANSALAAAQQAQADIDALENTVNSLSTELSNTQAAVTDAQEAAQAAQASAAEAENAALAAQEAAEAATGDGLAARVDQVELEVASAVATANQAQTDVDALEDRVTVIENQIASGELGGSGEVMQDIYISGWGDSRIFHSWNVTTARSSALARGYLWWTETLSQRVRLDYLYNMGVQSEPVSGLKARIVNDTANEWGIKPSGVPVGPAILHSGMESIATATSKADVDLVLADYQFVLDWLLERGHKVIVICEWPRTGLNTTSQKLLFYYVQRQRRLIYQNSNVWVVDTWDQLADPAAVDCSPASGMLNDDGVNISTGAAFVTAQAISACLAEMGMPRAEMRPSSNGDLYDAALNPSGCLNDNPLLQQGAGGTLSTGASGLVPEDYTLSCSETALSAVGSFVTVEIDGVQCPVYRVVVSGTPTANNAYVRIRQSGLISKVNALDLLEAGCEVHVHAGHTNFSAPGCMIDPGVSADRVYGGFSVTGDNPIPAAVAREFYACPQSAVYKAPDPIPASMSVEFRIQLTKAGVPASVTVDFLSAWLRKV